MDEAPIDGSQERAPRSEVVVLVDEDISHDRRVLAALSEHQGAVVIDCRSQEFASARLPMLAYPMALFRVICALARGVDLWRLLRRHHGLQAAGWFTGLRGSVRGYVRAQAVAAQLHSRMAGVRLIHAHDLFCGLIGAELSRRTRAKLVYDAHEVEFHRNRKNSWLRSAFDVTVERRVVEYADEIRVVNAPIAALYRQVHAIPADRVRVVANDHFLDSLCEVRADPADAEQVAIVYVGGGVNGRQLDKLAAGAAKLGVKVHGFFLDGVPPLAIASGWDLGNEDYQEELLLLASSHRCMMWCCVDHHCLSYRLSLPNKFFQALAVGIPVIAASGSYLAEIVEKYRIGAVFNGSNMEHLVAQMKSPVFGDWVAQVVAFRAELARGRVVI